MEINNHVKKIGNSAEIISLLDSFFEEVRNVAATSSLEKIQGSDYGWSYGLGGFFVYTEKYNKTLNELAKLINQKLPNEYDDKKQIKATLSDCSRRALSDRQSSKEFRKRFFEELIHAFSNEFELYFPNPLVLLPKSKNELQIGPVRVISLTLLHSEIKKKIYHFDSEYEVLISKEDNMNLSFKIADEGDYEIDIASSNWMWGVGVKASRANLNEEASWLISIACSLIRFGSIRWPENNPYFPFSGEVELDQFSNDTRNKQTFLRKKNDGYENVFPAPTNKYQMNTKVFNDLVSKKNQIKIDQVYYAEENQLGRRIQLALGWSAKARQSRDKSTRLIYFFTAIETLLSRSNAPVSDTIARFGAIVFSESISRRELHYNKIRGLYNFRNDTIHRGYRSMPKDMCDLLHVYVDNIIYKIYQNADLSQSFDEFSNKLKKASFGSKWNY